MPSKFCVKHGCLIHDHHIQRQWVFTIVLELRLVHIPLQQAVNGRRRMFCNGRQDLGCAGCGTAQPNTISFYQQLAYNLPHSGGLADAWPSTQQDHIIPETPSHRPALLPAHDVSAFLAIPLHHTLLVLLPVVQQCRLFHVLKLVVELQPPRQFNRTLPPRREDIRKIHPASSSVLSREGRCSGHLGKCCFGSDICRQELLDVAVGDLNLLPQGDDCCSEGCAVGTVHCGGHPFRPSPLVCRFKQLEVLPCQHEVFDGALGLRSVCVRLGAGRRIPWGCPAATCDRFGDGQLCLKEHFREHDGRAIEGLDRQFPSQCHVLDRGGDRAMIGHPKEA
mmetsp:Transcript_15189/g.44971  ORF Transcript_15189/g.44971 Transcript_15189/m.44971 type:complete len:335 (-) Transcript_15189:1132-2136(-)